MEENEIIPKPSVSGWSASGCLMWFLGGITLSFTIVSSIVLFVLLMGSLALNAYLGWQLSNLQITVSQKPPELPAILVVTATPEIAAQPTVANNLSPEPTLLPPPTATATPLAPSAQVEAQIATVSAIATSGAQGAAAFVPPVTTPTVAAAAPLNPVQQGEPAAQAAPPANAAAPADTPAHLPPAGDKVEAAAPYVSNNSYDLIPIEGERESRPAAEHGDLNLKLRAPEKIEAEPKLIEIDGSGIDPNAPNFSKVFKPEVTATYAIHNWDWAKNDKGELVNDGKAVLVELKTTPGQPLNIPPTGSDIYDGKYYAVVLYADEDSLTFLYARQGSVVKGYTVHLLGIETDPNLVKAFRDSEGSMLPGLTLTTPIGRTTDSVIVAIRDNGTFLDARSTKDWWD